MEKPGGEWNAARPPAGEPWAWLPRELLKSDAWRSAGVNTLRFVFLLMVEHMSHGGRKNGLLRATRCQQQAYGIHRRYTTGAIVEAEKLGLVDCRRGGQRVATLYALTWLPLHDGTSAANRWRDYRSCQPSVSSPRSRGRAGRRLSGNGVDASGMTSRAAIDALKEVP